MKITKWNDNWRAWEDHNSFALVFAVPESALEVELPFDFSFYKGQTADSVNQGRTGSIDGGCYNYYKKLRCEHKHYRLLLEGSGGTVQVFVNGSLAGESRYPYDRFLVELDPYLVHGGDNDILVSVRCPDLSSRYYVGGGLTRDVFLLEHGDVFTEPDSLKVSTLYTEGNCAKIRVEATVRNISAFPVRRSLKLDCAGTVTLYPIHIPAGGCFDFSAETYLEDITLWDDEHPALYEVSLSVGDDICSVTTGFRQLQYDARHGLRVNGREVKLRGACIHHDQGILGGSTYDDYELFRVRKLKEAGFNAIRSAHNPASQSLLKACDKLGVYVMDEGFDIWWKMKNNADYSLYFEENYREVLSRQVAGDYNHPSVIIYSTGNEISNINSLKGFETSLALTACYHELDRTRPVTNGINGAFAAGNDLIDVAADLTGKDREFFVDGDINKFMSIVATRMDDIVVHPAVTAVLEKLSPTMDIIGYNYMTARYVSDSSTYPQRIMAGTETYPRQIYANWESIKKCSSVIGDFTWTGFDYLGEVGPYPALVNPAGDVSVLGERTPVSYYRNIVFGLENKPYICVRSPENRLKPRFFGPWRLTDAEALWDYEEGALTSVEVFSSAPEVELFLNGRSLGTKAVRECQAFFDVPFEKGTLTAVAHYDGGDTSAELSTPGKLHEISTCIHKGDVLDIVEIRLLDEAGTQVFAPAELAVKGEVLAFASYGSPHPFTGNTVTVKNGRALLILKSGSEFAFDIKVQE